MQLHGLADALRHELPDGSLTPYDPVAPETLERLKCGIEQLVAPLSDCGAFCEDLIVELQNTHLGGVFKRRIAHRVPLDSSHKVIRLDDYGELKAWIKTTPWDQNNRRVEADFKAKITE